MCGSFSRFSVESFCSATGYFKLFGPSKWFFEKHLLGYSYSKKLKDVFADSHGSIRDSVYFNNMDLNQRGKFIGTVEDSIRRTSANGNQYIKVLILFCFIISINVNS